MPEQRFLGVDTGGTFTDFVLFEGEEVRIHKVLSTPDDPSRAILQGIAELGISLPDSALTVAHGSTVATNAALEGKGVRTAYITNAGLEDVLTIGRQSRVNITTLTPPLKRPPVAQALCLGVEVRRSVDGELVTALTEGAIAALRDKLAQLAPEAVAINLLHADRFGEDEQALRAAVPEGVFAALSSDVLPSQGEYERGMATWLNAWLGPVVERYLNNLAAGLNGSPLTVMHSAGGRMAVESAAKNAVRLLLSGPAGGLAAAKAVCAEPAGGKLLTFDMGGTSSDVALIDGDIKLTREGKIANYPVAVPMVDMHTIGAGGGSIIWIDEGGALQVGPQSAGANPGPACYGLGGEAPTVTDANAVLGKLGKGFDASQLQFDIEAARNAFTPLAKRLGMSVEDLARGALSIANENMTQALRVISLEKGYDPREFTLCCFGGAGGLHVCDLAENLSVSKIMVPRFGGVFSALGMLLAPRARQLTQSAHTELTDSLSDLDAEFASLETKAETQLVDEGARPENIRSSRSLDLCYAGQSFTLNIPWQNDTSALKSAFHNAHKQRYGHALDLPVSIVNLCVLAEDNSQAITLPTLSKSSVNNTPQVLRMYGIEAPVPAWQRESLAPGWQADGPLLLKEQTSTTWIKPGWQVCLSEEGHLLLEREAASH